MFEFDAWKRVFFEPDKVFAEQKRKASLNVALVWTIVTTVSVVGLSSFAVLGIGLKELILQVTGLSLIVGPIIIIVQNVVEYFFARILGGTGTFREQTYLSALIFVPCMATLLAIILLLRVTNNAIIGGILVLGMMFTVLFRAYLEFKMLKSIHNLSIENAVFGMSEINAWKGILFEPNRVLTELKPKSSIASGVITVVLAAALTAGIYELTVQTNAFDRTPSSLTYIFLLMTISAIVAVFLIVGGSLTSYAFSWVLGGTGKFREQLYLSAQMLVPIGFIISTLSVVSGGIYFFQHAIAFDNGLYGCPFMFALYQTSQYLESFVHAIIYSGGVASLWATAIAGLLLAIYYQYVQVKIMKLVHGIDTIKSAIIVAATVTIFVTIIIALFLFLNTGIT